MSGSRYSSSSESGCSKEEESSSGFDRGADQRGSGRGGCEMVGDYDGDSLFDEKLDLLLRSVQVGANVDLGTRGVD